MNILKAHKIIKDYEKEVTKFSKKLKFVDCHGEYIFITDDKNFYSTELSICNLDKTINELLKLKQFLTITRR